MPAYGVMTIHEVIPAQAGIQKPYTRLQTALGSCVIFSRLSRGNPYQAFSTRDIHGGAGFRPGQSAHNNKLALAVIQRRVDNEALAQEVLCRACTGISRSETASFWRWLRGIAQRQHRPSETP